MMSKRKLSRIKFDHKMLFQPKNTWILWGKKLLENRKISVYDYQAVKATETTFGKRLADLSYYYISFYEKFKELQSLNTKRSKSRGMVVTNNSSRGRIHKFNTTFNNDTANSSLENIEMFTYPTKEDITKQLKDLENSIRAKKESIRKIQQSFNYNTQTDRDSYRSLSQGEVVSDRAKTKSKRSTKNDEEN